MGNPNDTSNRTRKVVLEVVVAWLVTLLLIRLVVDGQRLTGVHEIVLAAVPILFMYAPVYVLRWRGLDSEAYPLALPPIRDPAWRTALRWNALFIGAMVIPWVVGYHLYQTELFPWLSQTFLGDLPKRTASYQGIWPDSMLKLIGFHLFYVAIPEEFFYRGYVQSRLEEAFGPKWRIFGVELGWGWLLSCVIFAFGHSIVSFQWWHFAIIFPSLVFGWLRARTGQVMAGAFFHAWCNVLVTTLDTLYGLVPPDGEPGPTVQMLAIGDTEKEIHFAGECKRIPWDELHTALKAEKVRLHSSIPKGKRVEMRCYRTGTTVPTTFDADFPVEDALAQYDNLDGRWRYCFGGLRVESGGKPDWKACVYDSDRPTTRSYEIR